MAKNILYLSGGLALGLVIAALFYLVVDPTRSEGSFEPADAGRMDPRLERCLADLSREVARLAEAVNGIQSPGMVHETGDVAPSTLEIFTDWIAVMDKELAAALVESGMTPYDPCVAPLVKEAAGKLREVDKVYGESSVQTSEMFRNKGLSKESYMAQREAGRKRHQEKRDAILKDFRESLPPE